MNRLRLTPVSLKLARTSDFCRLALIAACLGLGLLLGACSGHSSKPAAPEAAADAGGTPAGGPTSLPGPLEVLRQSSAPDFSGRLLRPHVLAGPSAYVQTSALSLKFDPDCELDDPGPLGPAYALYRFDGLTGYGGAARLSVGLTAAPLDTELYGGLGNLQSGRWDWRKLNAAGQADFGTLSPYISDQGEVIAALLAMGHGEAEISWVLLGSNSDPDCAVSTDLNVDPTQNFGPLEVNLDATGSRSYGGPLVGFDFDWDGDGNYDLLDDTDGLAAHTYDLGQYTLRVRCRDNEGLSATAELPIVIINPANSAPQASFTMSTDSGPAPLSVSFDASGTSDDGQIIEYEWDFDGDGQFEHSNGADPLVQFSFARKGSNTVRLRVTDNDLAQASVSDSLQLSSGWARTTVASGVDLNGTQLSACSDFTLINSVPCVAWYDYTDKQLWFARGSSSNGASWHAPLQPAPSQTDSGSGPSLAIDPQSGRPMIAYGEYGLNGPDYALKFVRAANDGCTSWDSPVLVDASSDAGGSNSLAVVGGQPAIASICDLYGNFSSLRYYTPDDSSYGSWSSSVLIPDGLGAFRDLDLMEVAGKPYLLAPIYRPDNSAILSVSAADAAGSAWDPPQELYPLASNYFDARLIDGRPSFISSNSQYTGELSWGAALDSAASAWAPATQELGLGSFCSLASIDGKPAIGYCQPEQRRLYYRQALDAAATAWDEPQLVDMGGGVGEGAILLSVDGAPLLIYYDRFNDKLLCAHFEN